MISFFVFDASNDVKFRKDFLYFLYYIVRQVFTQKHHHWFFFFTLPARQNQVTIGQYLCFYILITQLLRPNIYAFTLQQLSFHIPSSAHFSSKITSFTLFFLSFSLKYIKTHLIISSFLPKSTCPFCNFTFGKNRTFSLFLFRLFIISFPRSFIFTPNYNAFVTTLFGCFEKNN